MQTLLAWLAQPAHVVLVLSLVLSLVILIASQFHNPTAERVTAIANGIKSLVPLARRKGPMFIVLVNHDSARADISPAWLNQVAAAFAKDLEPFCAEYGIGAWSITTDQGMPGPRLAIFGRSDVPGALGYHDVGPNGLPYGDAFSDGQTLDELSETLSHEAKELIGDLYADRWRFRASDGKGFAEEACDAVQGTPYRVDGILCANHVTQAWYQEGSKAPWDHNGALTQDHELTPGGYVITMTNGKVDTEPHMAKFAARKVRPNSRTAKRLRAAGVRPVRSQAGNEVVGFTAGRVP